MLQAYLSEADEAKSSRLIVDLICEYIEPLVKRIVSSRLGVDNTRQGTEREQQDAEDVCSEVIVQILRRLRRWKASTRTELLSDFSRYVVAAAYNGCNLYLRKKYPERTRIKKRLQYIVRSE